MSFPKFLYGNDAEGVIVMEDLRESGYAMEDKSKRT